MPRPLRARALRMRMLQGQLTVRGRLELEVPSGAERLEQVNQEHRPGEAENVGVGIPASCMAPAGRWSRFRPFPNPGKGAAAAPDLTADCGEVKRLVFRVNLPRYNTAQF